MANQYAGISTHIASRNAAINNNNGGNSGGVSMAASIGEIQPEHQKALDTTKQFVIGCLPEYRRRNGKFIKWMKDNYIDYYNEVVYDLTPQQQANKTLYPGNNCTQDLRYDRLNVKMTTLFISANKINPSTGQNYGYDNLRKYHDAILYGSKLAEVPLPAEYRANMKTYLDTFKKEATKAKSEGKTKEQDADPIPFALYKLICKWAVESGCIMVWAFTVMQWNCIGRTINIAPLGFRNLSCKEAEDSIAVHYDLNKKDQKGELTSAKNCYANPFNPVICMFLALGCYLCSAIHMFDGESDKIFRKNGKDRSAADTYCKALRKMIDAVATRGATILTFCREGHFHAHGSRKGAAMMVTTATMEPPPMPSVLLRGEWSLGKVLDIYWRWSRLGDTYLGRLLAGLDPDNEDQFASLPPHFTQGIENEYIKEGMMLCFGNIITSWGKDGIINVLLLLLASIVYHSEWLFEVANGNSNHPFNTIPVLQRPELLDKLKELVTLEPAGTITKASGVPLHIKQSTQLKKNLLVIKSGMDKLLAANAALPEVIKAAIDEVATGAGQVTVPRVMELMDQHSGSMQETIAKTVKDAVEEATRDLVPRGGVPTQHTPTTWDSFQLGTYREYNGSAVPSNFKFPTVGLRLAWQYYLLGMPGNRSKHPETNELMPAPIRALRYIDSRRNLPKGHLRSDFNDRWRPVLEEMYDATKEHFAGKREEDMNAEFLDTTYTTAMEGLESKYPTLFVQKNKSYTWKVSTWSSKMRAAKRAAKRASQDE